MTAAGTLTTLLLLLLLLRLSLQGVFGAASGAGIIIGSYFAFYSNSKKLLREHTDMTESSIAFVSGAIAAVGSSVVKVPLAVCIRSVQAGVYPNFYAAAKSIIDKAGPQGLFTVRPRPQREKCVCACVLRALRSACMPPLGFERDALSNCVLDCPDEWLAPLNLRTSACCLWGS